MRCLLLICLPASLLAAPTCVINWPANSIPSTIATRTTYPGNTYRSGSKVVLDGTGSSGTGALTYQWAQISNLTTGITSAIVNGLPSTSATPTVNVHVPPGQTGPAPFDVSLTVTDNTGSTTCYESNGVVPMTDKGAAILPTGAVSTILQQPMGYQKDPWLFRDTAAADVSALFCGTYDCQQTGTPNYYTTVSGGWNTAKSGTISSITNFTTGTCPSPYTSTFPNGCFELTGSGTNFANDYCGGGTSFSGPNIVVWYLTGRTLPSSQPETGRMWIQYGACIDATHMIGSMGGSEENQSITSWPGNAAGWSGVTGQVLAAASQTNLSYSSTNLNGCTSNAGSCWWDSSRPPYYDPGMLFYSLWYRSGIDIHLYNARAWTDAAWNGPWMDRGFDIAWGNFPGCVNAENCYGLNFGGLVLRALDTSDGHLEMWTGLEHLLYWNANYIANNAFNGQDARISGAALITESLGALYDPGSNNYSTSWCPFCSSVFPAIGTMTWNQFARTNIHSALSNYTGGRDSVQHGWLTYYSEMSSYDVGQTWSGQLASLTHNSTTVTCTGCGWTNTMFATKVDVQNSGATCVSGPTCVYPTIAFFNNASNTDSSVQDNVAYCQGGCSLSGSTLTLDVPYAGTTGSHNWVSSRNASGGLILSYVTVSGWGQDSFMEGVLGAGFQLASQACTGTPTGCSSGDDTSYAGYSQDATNWILNWALIPSYYAMSYFAGFPQCIAGGSPPISISTGNVQCNSGWGNVGSREIMGDSITGMIRAYVASPATTLRTILDNWYAGMWAKPSVGNPPLPSPDGAYDSSFDSAGCAYSATWPFYTGSCGFWIYTPSVSQPQGSQKAIAQHFGISISDTWPSVRLLGVPVATLPSVQ